MFCARQAEVQNSTAVLKLKFCAKLNFCVSAGNIWDLAEKVD